ncbi:GGDEF domain-containing protein [Rubeoparvulum massiliense]|uniref:GGDEF domain-containing protein n=1 Tax=Rubeoparvulum massiliense TaxID=1631346 RepID=UPI00065DFC2C|nr:sensor domain-containing diguanylate cyclase [Rubeoparvulum massiliense]
MQKRSGFLLILLFISYLVFVVGSWVLQPSWDWSQWPLFFSLLILQIMTYAYPLVIKQQRVILSLTVTLPLLYTWGMVAELWVTQLAIILATLQNPRRTWQEGAGSLISAGWSSFIAGLVYTEVRNELLHYPFSHINTISSLLLYVLIYLVLSLLIHAFLEQERIRFSHVLFLIPFHFLAIVLSFLLILVIEELGLIGFLFFAVPYLGMVILINTYEENKLANHNLQTLYQTCFRFTSQLERERVLDAVHEAMAQILPGNYYSIHLVDGEQLIQWTGTEDHKSTTVPNGTIRRIPLGKGVVGRVAATSKPMLIYDLFELLSVPEPIEEEAQFRSMVAVPIIGDGKVLGVLSCADSAEFTYRKEHVTYLQILAGQASVALLNAYQFGITERRARYDELTGLFNYRTFLQILTERLESARIEEVPYSLLMIDLDYFKKVNDTYGHLAGNQVLQECARLFKGSLRNPQDVVARYGGEEFVILLNNMEQEEAYLWAEQLRSVIAQTPIQIPSTLQEDGWHSIQITLSIGIATYPIQGQVGSELLRYADRAMYRGAKQEGRNRVAIYA